MSPSEGKCVLVEVGALLSVPYMWPSMTFLPSEDLRAVVSNFRESGDRAENSNFFLFAQKNPFGELFSKIILKSSSECLFWQKNGKFEIGLNGPSDLM